jgi:hypothetical protein
VLTEPSRFDGALSHLAQAVSGTGRTHSAMRVPVMRKDFLVDPYQVYEARLAGAGGVLIILRMLEPGADRGTARGGAQLRCSRCWRPSMRRIWCSQRSWCASTASAPRCWWA